MVVVVTIVWQHLQSDGTTVKPLMLWCALYLANFASLTKLLN